MVFQSYAIFPHLDVRQNLAYGLRRARLPRQELQKKIDDALALIKQPKVLLLDEPLGALDKRLREQMQTELRALQKEVGITFVFVTHDQEEALSLADRIAVLSEGRILQVDTPERLYERPVSREVADFIGTMNFIDARVQAVNANVVTVETEALGEMQATTELAFRSGDRVLIAIRPEKIVAGEEAPGGESNKVRGRIAATSYLGDRSHLQVHVPGLGHPLSVASQNVLPLLHGTRANEDALWLSWPVEAAVLLPPE